MEKDWYPISPLLEAKPTPEVGAFLALRTFPRASELTPVQLGAGKEHFNEWSDTGTSHSLRVATQLGVGGVFSGAVMSETKNITFRWIWSAQEILADDPRGGLIWGTRWGAGIRVHVRTSTIQADSKLTLPGLAAQTELGRVDARFEVETFGLRSAKVLAYLPGPGRLDLAAAARLLKAGDYLHGLSKEDRKAQLTPVPFEIQAPTSFFQTPVFNALSTLFAFSEMGAGTSYDDAIGRARALQADRQLSRISLLKVHRLYAHKGIAPGEAPTDTDKAWAQGVLD